MAPRRRTADEKWEKKHSNASKRHCRRTLYKRASALFSFSTNDSGGGSGAIFFWLIKINAFNISTVPKAGWLAALHLYTNSLCSPTHLLTHSDLPIHNWPIWSELCCRLRYFSVQQPTQCLLFLSFSRFSWSVNAYFQIVPFIWLTVVVVAAVAAVVELYWPAVAPAP